MTNQKDRYTDDIRERGHVRLANHIETVATGIGAGVQGLRSILAPANARAAGDNLPGVADTISDTATILGKEIRNPISFRGDFEENNERISWYNQHIRKIQTFHRQGNAPVDWKGIAVSEPPFDKEQPGPLEAAATKEMEAMKPSLLESMIPSLYQDRVDRALDKVDAAREQDMQDYMGWMDLRRLANALVSGDTEAFYYVLEEMSPFDELIDYGVDMDINVISPDAVEAVFYAKGSSVVPDTTLSMSLLGNLVTSPMDEGTRHQIVQEYVCSSALRIARELFALLPVDKVLIHIIDDIDRRKGITHNVTVLSMLMTEEESSRINYDIVNPTDAVSFCTCNMNFTKGRGFKQVKRLGL